MSLQGLPPEEALGLIPSLPFSRIASLPALRFDAAPDGQAWIAIDAVLAALEPRRKPSPPAAQANPASGASAPRADNPQSTPTSVDTNAARRAPAGPPRAFYSHVAMRADVIALLETLFGLGATKKVDEFARDAPPLQRPGEFLDKCMKQAAMMIGHRKAAQMFASVYAKAGLPLP